MTRYVLHARSFAGPLCAPERNELLTAEGDDRQELDHLADELRERGYTCWLYERRPASPGSLAVTGRSESWHVLSERHPSQDREPDPYA